MEEIMKTGRSGWLLGWMECQVGCGGVDGSAEGFIPFGVTGWLAKGLGWRGGGRHLAQQQT